MPRWPAIATAIVISGFGATLALGQGPAHRASIAIAGGDADCISIEPCLSADGRFIAFQSYASNLVPGDTNGCSDVFVHDRVTGLTERVSISSSGEQGSFYSGEPAISADGRFIAFRSDATNLVPADTNGVADVFVYERVTRKTWRVSTCPGRAEPNGPSGRPSISRDGRFVAFESEATNLVPGDRNGVQDVFVRDREGLVTTRISVVPSGDAGGASRSPSISGDGRAVAFVSRAPNFAREAADDLDDDVFLFDFRGRTLTLLSADEGGCAGGGDAPVISEDGSVVVFESAARLCRTDRNADRDVYYHRVRAGLLDVASVATSGTPGRRWELVPDFGPPATIRAHSGGATVSRDGRHVAFVSFADGLAPGAVRGAEVYVRDIESGKTRRVPAAASDAAACLADPVLGGFECPPVRAFIAGNGSVVGIQARGHGTAGDRDDILVVDLAGADRSTQAKADRESEERPRVR
jgi:Tol biopolymer transport system component